MDNVGEDIQKILADPDHHFNCMQVAPFGDGRVAILWELGTIDHSIAYSVIWEVEDFDPANAKRTLLHDDWFISLTAAAPDRLHALEVGRTVWTYDGKDWESEVVANTMMNRIWALNDEMILLFGYKGRAWRGDGQIWSAIEPTRRVQILDAHGPDRNRIWAAGNSGFLQKLNEDGWAALDTGTHLDFRGIHVESDNDIRVAGDEGTCIRIVNDELLNLDNPGSTFFSVRKYRGEFYWGDSEFGVFLEKDGKLEPFFKTGLGYDLRTDEEYLYCVGLDRAWRFDGADWLSLQLSYDGEFRLTT